MARAEGGRRSRGWVCLDKPLDLTSTQAVGRVRRPFNAQKAGHAGTLDPLATGILPIALGEATKTVPFLMDADKAYRFTIAWGVDHHQLRPRGRDHRDLGRAPDRARVEAALPAFVGEILQIPPAFSAVKVDGERAYDLAREGVEVELEPRPVDDPRRRGGGQPDADHVEIETMRQGDLCPRAGPRPGRGAGRLRPRRRLRRTAVGPLSEAGDKAWKAGRLCHSGARLEALLPVETALDDIPALAVTTEDAFRLTQGRSIVLLPQAGGGV